jgi:rhodanese-related sulfurtransferase
MTRRASFSLIALLILVSGGASCAPASKQPAVQPPVSKDPKTPTEFKKPPRMNGRGEVSSISLTDAFALRESGQALIYDARPAFFYHLGHIPGAISLPKSDADRLIHEREQEIKNALSTKKTIVVYCTNFACPDARAVARHISGFGYPSSTLTGGWDAWKESALPTE